MGVSTDALLFYGFEIEGPEDEGGPFWGDAEDWETFVAAKLGYKPPDVEFSKETESHYQLYWKQKREAIASLGVSVEEHCSNECPMYALRVNDSFSCAKRGRPIKFTAADFKVSTRWVASLKMFCDLVGLKYREPSWLLASMWG